MKRIAAAFVLAAAFAGPAAAQTSPPNPVDLHYRVDENGVGVGVGVAGIPVGGAHANPDGEVCAGLFYEVPQCVGPLSR